MLHLLSNQEITNQSTTKVRNNMKNFKKAYEAEIAKFRIIFPSESREQLEYLFVKLMRDEKPINLDCSINELGHRLEELKETA